MKLLNGKELAGYIKERHAHQVRALLANKVLPKLIIIQTKDDPVINTYVKLKCQYGADIGIEVELHGVIVQLPLANPADTDEIVRLIPLSKDVDALNPGSTFEPATPMAIMWLLAGFNVDLNGRQILLIGRGRLVGAPLEQILKNSGYKVEVIDREIDNLAEKTQAADIIITATGSPAILYSSMIKQGAVVIDAGVASEEGKTVGDLAPDVYERDDLTITPEKGGVGPLTVCALFENVIRSANEQV
jgi:methylenetetrahydrofolate dehydrogenase (NADP+)/methenyltetrahydrofolate cyclohydrolase